MARAAPIGALPARHRGHCGLSPGRGRGSPAAIGRDNPAPPRDLPLHRLNTTALKLLVSHFWRGGYALGPSFWLFGVAGTLAFTAAIAGLIAWIGEPSLPVVIAIAVAGAAMQAWIIVGVWRSANRYAGPPAYRLAARIAVALYALLCVTTLLQVFGILLLGGLVLLNPPFIR